MKLKGKVFLVVLLSISLTILSSSIILSIRDTRFFPSNYMLDNLDLGSIPKSQISHVVNDIYSDKHLILAMPAGQNKLSINDCGIAINIDKTFEQINKTRLLDNVTRRVTTQVIQPIYQWDKNKLREVIEDFALANSRDALDAQLIWENNTTKYLAQENGQYIDGKQLLENIESHLQGGSLGPIAVEVEVVYPIMTLEELKDIEQLRGDSSPMLNYKISSPPSLK